LTHKHELTAMLDGGVDIIIANSWEYEELIREYAPKNPETLFVLNDVAISGFENVISLVYSQHEGAFLAGALASLVTQTNKIGFVGGMDIPVIGSFERGFEEGIQYINKNIKLTKKYLAGNGTVGVGFKIPRLGYTIAQQLYDSDVDVIFSVAGLSGNGVIRAAAERKRYVIGVDSDQDSMAKGYVLTSVMKRMDKAVNSVLTEILNDNIVPGVHLFNLKNGGVSLTPMLFSRDVVTEDIVEVLEIVKTKIILNQIEVTNTLSETQPPVGNNN